MDRNYLRNGVYSVWRHDRRLYSIRLFLFRVSLTSSGCIFSSWLPPMLRFLFNCSCYISLFDCSCHGLYFDCAVSNYPTSAFLFTPVGERGLILSTPRVLLVNHLVFVAASHQTRLDTRSKARRPIKVGIKGRGRSGTSRDSNPACLCCSSAHLVQCEPDEASSFTNPNVGPGTYAS